MTRLSENNHGFTLIELLIVVVIVGMLATVAMIQLSAYRIRGNNSAAVSELKSLRIVLEAYYADNKHYP